MEPARLYTTCPHPIFLYKSRGLAPPPIWLAFICIAHGSVMGLGELGPSDY